MDGKKVAREMRRQYFMGGVLQRWPPLFLYLVLLTQITVFPLKPSYFVYQRFAVSSNPGLR